MMLGNIAHTVNQVFTLPSQSEQGLAEDIWDIEVLDEQLASDYNFLLAFVTSVNFIAIVTLAKRALDIQHSTMPTKRKRNYQLTIMKQILVLTPLMVIPHMISPPTTSTSLSNFVKKIIPTFSPIFAGVSVLLSTMIYLGNPRDLPHDE